MSPAPESGFPSVRPGRRRSGTTLSLLGFLLCGLTWVGCGDQGAESITFEGDKDSVKESILGAPEAPTAKGGQVKSMSPGGKSIQ